jgi:hypothetical protein
LPAPQGSKPASLSIDFEGVEERRQGGSAAHVPAGDYIVQVSDYEVRTKKDDASRKYISWQLKIVAPAEFKGKKVYFVTSLVKESLWNLRNFLEDMGVKVPAKLVDVPLAKLKGRQVGVTLDDDEYEGKIKSKVVSTFNKNDWGEAETPTEAGDEEAEVAATSTADYDEELEELDVDDDI